MTVTVSTKYEEDYPLITTSGRMFDLQELQSYTLRCDAEIEKHRVNRVGSTSGCSQRWRRLGNS